MDNDIKRLILQGGWMHRIDSFHSDYSNNSREREQKENACVLHISQHACSKEGSFAIFELLNNVPTTISSGQGHDSCLEKFMIAEGCYFVVNCKTSVGS